MLGPASTLSSSLRRPAARGRRSDAATVLVAITLGQRRRQQAQRLVRRGVSQLRHPDRQDARAGTTGKRHRRALRQNHPRRVPELATDPQPPPPPARAARLRRPLQRPQAAPRAQAPVTATSRTTADSNHRRGRAPRPPRRPHPRALPNCRVTATRLRRGDERAWSAWPSSVRSTARGLGGHGTHAGCSPRGRGHCTRTAEARRLLRPAAPRNTPRPAACRAITTTGPLPSRTGPATPGKEPGNAVQAYTPDPPTIREPERVVEQRERAPRWERPLAVILRLRPRRRPGP
jgi:hypothetical protein